MISTPTTERAVGPREPCPCGSGRRYKACHGRPGGPPDFVGRPFAGLPGEPDWIAFREILPAATAPLRLRDGRTALLVTVLPTGWAALHRRDGVVLLGAQTTARSGDLSRDLAWALEEALAAEPGTPVVATGAPGPGARLQDLLEGDRLEVTVHGDFGFWLPEGEGVDAEATASLERANAAIVPTAAVPGADAAYWCRIRDVLHLRWVLPYAEEAFFDAAARLQAAGALGVGERTHFVGTFRAHGLVAPVWDLAEGTTAQDLAGPVAELKARLDAAVASAEPLTGEERRQRSGLLSRQITLR